MNLLNGIIVSCLAIFELGFCFFFLDLRIVKVKSSKEKTVRIKSRRHEKYGGKMLLHMLVCMHVQSHFSCVWLFATLCTVACQALLSMESSRQEYWNGLPCPPPADLPNPEIKPVSLASPALADRLFFVTSAAWKAPQVFRIVSMIHGKPNSLTVRKWEK